MARPVHCWACMKLELDKIKAERSWLRRFGEIAAERFADILGLEEVHALVDLGICEAWKLFDPDRGAFTTFARQFVLGSVRLAVRREIRHRRFLAELKMHQPHFDTATPEMVTIGTDLLGRLSVAEQEFMCRHAGGGDSLSELARGAGRHRAWATRRRKSIMSRLRVLEISAR